MAKNFLRIAIVVIFCGVAFQYWPVTIHLRSASSAEIVSIRMPSKDKRRLEFFFREVCFLNVWAYTLMGSKPMSIDQYTRPWNAFRNSVSSADFKDIFLECFWPPNLRKMRYHLSPKELKMKLGWETLNKYSEYFPDSRFFLYTNQRNDQEIVDLILVDKKKVAAVVKGHFEDFRQVLKNLEMTPEDLLYKENMRVFLKSLQHNGLFGTILGFGRENAWQFFRYQEIDPKERPMVSAWPEEEIVNLEQLNKRIQSFQTWEVTDLFYPRFACDPQSEETKKVKQIYREEREKILKYYEGKDLVEATLNLFSQT